MLDEIYNVITLHKGDFIRTLHGVQFWSYPSVHEVIVGDGSGSEEIGDIIIECESVVLTIINDPEMIHHFTFKLHDDGHSDGSFEFLGYELYYNESYNIMD